MSNRLAHIGRLDCSLTIFERLFGIVEVLVSQDRRWISTSFVLFEVALLPGLLDLIKFLN